jgi:hypothetical protein
MPWVGFEPTIPASEQAKTVHDLDRSATVTGSVGDIKVVGVVHKYNLAHISTAFITMRTYYIQISLHSNS